MYLGEIFMGVSEKLLNFLFGKKPNIFDKNGNVRHILPNEKWDAWNNRYQQGAEYNWKNHNGMRPSHDSLNNKQKN